MLGVQVLRDQCTYITSFFIVKKCSSGSVFAHSHTGIRY
ncbi:hypothetical protein TcasGA2_TC032514 [Tribolium castaneum]|uniref:Uncharacterized protein n=1 Tax=Tribolium castaneum TaxID=7070 RepID=A0A139WKQ5_TRICA|nr:hypothetical protein TcasGA2_TC032514 [Tribolium castaneum]